ncbi:MAG: peptidoglycan-binding domain-containing protein [Candidatus Paceibacterota bacterium]|jgi:peptidoglycan hydrolase-like protein with peptidoglycan-binding domain
MRLFYLFILFILFSSAQAILAVEIAPISVDCIIVTTLRMGSRGAEVKCLQKKVGAVADGSFGPLTNVAVKAFQLNNGLVADGIVGHLTLSALNGVLVDKGNYPTGCKGITGYSPITGIKCDSYSNPLAPAPLVNSVSATNSNNTENVNPNLANLDQAIETIVEVNRKNGSSETELQLMADTVRDVVTNSDVDLNQEFENLLMQEAKLSTNFKPKSPLAIFDKFVSKTLSLLGITPSIAQAQTEFFAFGSSYALAIPCMGSFMIVMLPLPPKGVKLLSYYQGTQGFASYNIASPTSKSLLGFYEPVGVCSYSIVNIKTEGTILPMVGSSPLLPT